MIIGRHETQGVLDTLLSNFVYDQNTGLLTRCVASKTRPDCLGVVGSLNNSGYLTFKCGVSLSVHRAVWAISYGRWPKHEIDHINRVRTDNRLINLREATRNENAENTKLYATSTSGYRGVSWHKASQNWVARVRFNGVNYSLGYFNDIDAAVHARKVFEETHYKTRKINAV